MKKCVLPLSRRKNVMKLKDSTKTEIVIAKVKKKLGVVIICLLLLPRYKFVHEVLKFIIKASCSCVV